MLPVSNPQYSLTRVIPVRRLARTDRALNSLRFASQPQPDPSAAKPKRWKRMLNWIWKLIKWPFSHLAKLFRWSRPTSQPSDKPTEPEPATPPRTEPSTSTSTQPPQAPPPAEESYKQSEHLPLQPTAPSLQTPKPPESTIIRPNPRPLQTQQPPESTLKPLLQSSAPLLRPDVERSLLYKVAIHELGHALVGKAAGFELKCIQVNPDQPLKNSFTRVNKLSFVGKTLDHVLGMNLLMLMGSYASQFLFVNPDRLTDIRQDPQNAFIFDIQYALDHFREMKQQYLPYLQHQPLKGWLQTQPLNDVSYSQVFDLAPVQAAIQCSIRILRLIDPNIMQRMALELMQQHTIVGKEATDHYFSRYIPSQTFRNMQEIAQAFLNSPLAGFSAQN